MSCPECKERQRLVLKAWQDHNIKEAVKQVVIGAAEIVGLKQKVSDPEPVADDTAPALPVQRRKSGKQEK